MISYLPIFFFSKVSTFLRRFSRFLRVSGIVQYRHFPQEGEDLSAQTPVQAIAGWGHWLRPTSTGETLLPKPQRDKFRTCRRACAQNPAKQGNKTIWIRVDQQNHGSMIAPRQPIDFNLRAGMKRNPFGLLASWWLRSCAGISRHVTARYNRENSCYSIFGIAVNREHELKWLFHQEKSRLSLLLKSLHVFRRCSRSVS